MLDFKDSLVTNVDMDTGLYYYNQLQNYNYIYFYFILPLVVPLVVPLVIPVVVLVPLPHLN